MVTGNAKLDDRAFDINSINMSEAWASLNIFLPQGPHVYNTEIMTCLQQLQEKKRRVKKDEIIVEV